MNNEQQTMWTKSRIRLFIALAVIMVGGAILSLNNLRPVSERKQNNSRKIDSAEEVQKTQNKIKILSDSIKEYSKINTTILNRARLYKSINNLEEAIVDYNNFIAKTTDDKLKMIAQKELKSLQNVKEHLEKMKK